MLLKVLLLIVVWVFSSFAQSPDSVDTLYLRGDSFVLMPKYDTVKQLQKANQKATAILEDLEVIKKELGIKDTIR